MKKDIEVQIDEKTLQDIATITDGKYFRATNNKSLKDIYEDINKLEKSKIETTKYHKRKEEFLPYALLTLILLTMSFVLKTTFLNLYSHLTLLHLQVSQMVWQVESQELLEKLLSLIKKINLMHVNLFQV